MKRKLFALAIAGSLICMASQAQIGKGSLLFGGNIGFSSIKMNNNPSRNINAPYRLQEINISPSFGVFVAPNWLVGADLVFNNKTEKVDNASSVIKTKSKNNAFGGGVFVRRYWEAAKRFYIFGEGRLGHLISKIEALPNETDYYYKYNMTSLTLRPGLSFAVSKKIHLESTLFDVLTVSHTVARFSQSRNVPFHSKNRNFSVQSDIDGNLNVTLGIKILLSK